MEVRTNTWHYAAWRYGLLLRDESKNPAEPTNLCSYFWGVVFGLAAIPFLALMALGFLSMIGILLWHWCQDVWGWITGPSALPSTVGALKWLGIELLYILGIILAVFLGGALLYGIGACFKSDTARVVGAYFKAVKDRVCPLITFKPAS